MKGLSDRNENAFRKNAVLLWRFRARRLSTFTLPAKRTAVQLRELPEGDIQSGRAPDVSPAKLDFPMAERSQAIGGGCVFLRAGCSRPWEVPIFGAELLLASTK
jgi:hypothetical protein